MPVPNKKKKRVTIASNIAATIRTTTCRFTAGPSSLERGHQTCDVIVASLQLTGTSNALLLGERFREIGRLSHHRPNMTSSW